MRQSNSKSAATVKDEQWLEKMAPILQGMLEEFGVTVEHQTAVALLDSRRLAIAAERGVSPAQARRMVTEMRLLSFACAVAMEYGSPPPAMTRKIDGQLLVDTCRALLGAARFVAFDNVCWSVDLVRAADDLLRCAPGLWDDDTIDSRDAGQAMGIAYRALEDFVRSNPSFGAGLRLVDDETPEAEGAAQYAVAERILDEIGKALPPPHWNEEAWN